MADINTLHPWPRMKANELVKLCKDNGIDIIISQTWRTKEYQDSLYAQGRTKPGKIVTKAKYPQSLHCWGIAFDIVPIVNGKAAWGRIDLFDKVGALGQQIGLEWGGSWKTFVDKPHFQVPGYTWQGLQKKWGTPERYIASWTKK